MNKLLFYLSIQNMAVQTTKLETNDILDIVYKIVTEKNFESTFRYKSLTFHLSYDKKN